MLCVRPLEPRDREAVTALWRSGRSDLRARGVDQWQGGYPGEREFDSDLFLGCGRVVELDGTVAAYWAWTREKDNSYALASIPWPDSGRKFSVIHRVAVNEGLRGRGVSSIIFSSAAGEAEALGYGSLRADTHPDNLRMRRALERNGFVMAGPLVMVDGPEKGEERVAYVLVFDSEG